MLIEVGSGVPVCVQGPVTAWGGVRGDPPDFSLVVSASWAAGALGPSPQVNYLMGWVGVGSGTSPGHPGAGRSPGVFEAPLSLLGHLAQWRLSEASPAI